MRKIVPFMLFNDEAEEAAQFYTSIFKNSKIEKIQRHTEVGPGPKGSVLFVTFQLDGEEFYALNAGSQINYTPAPSFFVNCKTQEEVDEYWEKLSAGGKTLGCGWLLDKYGVSWNIVPTILGEMMEDKDAEKSKRVFLAMMQMNKLDIKGLQRAYDGKETVKSGV